VGTSYRRGTLRRLPRHGQEESHPAHGESEHTEPRPETEKCGEHALAGAPCMRPSDHSIEAHRLSRLFTEKVHRLSTQVTGGIQIFPGQPRFDSAEGIYEIQSRRALAELFPGRE
jgi:hypothetical protein